MQQFLCKFPNLVSVNGVLDYYSNEQIISVLATAFCPTIGWGIGVEEAMSVPDWLKTNAYRVLRIPAGVSLSEVHKAATSMRRAALLGAVRATEADIPVLGEIPRTEADIRVATGRLENPSQRIFDRLFWLHSIDISMSVRTGGLNPALWNHDEALRGIFAAFESGFDEAGIWAWARALRAWHQAVSDEDYWVRSLEFEHEGGFEPAAFPSEFDELRYKAVELAAEPLVMAGRDALVRNDASVVRLVLFTLDQLADTGYWVSAAQRDIASPAIESFRKLCRAVSEDFSSKVVREQDAAKQNKSVCAAEIARYRTDVEPELKRIIQLLPPGYEGVLEAREEAALLLSAVATDYTWADDFITSEKLREEALKLAENTLGAIRIEDGLEHIRASAQTQRVFGKSISSAPTLGTINGFGCTLYGSSDYDPETKSYSTTHYFVALFIPIFPLGRYRVINVGGNTYRFLGKLPFRKADRWHLGIVLSAIAAMILIGMISSNQSSSYVPATSPSSSYTYPSGGYTDSNTSEPSSSNATTSSATTSGARSHNANLTALGQRIDAGRARITSIETRLKPIVDELDSLTARIKQLEAEIKALDQQQADGIDIDTHRRSSLYDEYDRLFKKRRALVEANSSDFKVYKDLLKADDDLMEQWKALGGKVN